MKIKPTFALLILFLFSASNFEIDAQTKRRRAPRPQSAAVTTPTGLTYLITKKEPAGNSKPVTQSY